MKIWNVIVRLLLFLFGAASFSGFFLPVLRRRILNIGNAVGIVLCVCLILYALFLPSVHRWIHTFWQKRIGKIILGIFAAGMIAGVVLVIVMTTLMIRAASTKPDSNATVVVLGCKVYGCLLYTSDAADER